MSISDGLAELNHRRFQDWAQPFTTTNAKPAIEAFKGDVYTGFELDSFKSADFKYAQRHLRILSGLHGVLRPLDLIQPYRLEMGTSLAVGQARNLYEFWRPVVTETLNGAIAGSGSRGLVNLASVEYFGAVSVKELDARVVTPVFKDRKNGRYKVISFFAKKARGAMCDFMIRNRVNEAEGLRGFTGLGYALDPDQSTGDTLTFLRDEPSD
jgi:cytoplasmic iron level regulating protein YaaA (DUF328/UPF0246 family)